jgi:arylsulfatase A-like enzyme/tetratricopeptide (TPR) repeat protein
VSRRLAAAVAAAFASLLALGGCRGGGQRLSFPKAPVILISVDTLRADRLPAYGYTSVQTPAIDALRKESVLFENAYAHVPLTLPSHASLFTGQLPQDNGVRDNMGYRLGPGPETLAAFYGKAGYTTGGAISSLVLAGTTGIGRGFSKWEDDVEPKSMNETLGRVQRDGAETTARLTEWLKAQPKEKPLFLFLHLFEPHSPWEPPEPFRSRYRDRYDGEVARADEIVGGFLGTLKEMEIYDDAIVVFLSDHGEGLRDHGEEEHGVLLYREAIHVPLIVKLPGARRGNATVSAPVALTDLFPTLARLTGLEPPAGLAGLDLTGAIAGGSLPARRIYSETMYPRLHLGWSDLASLVDERWHYIHGPRAELYDVPADPREKKDLAAGLPPAFRSMRAELERMPRTLQPPGQSDPEQVAKLAALGYIGGQAPELDAKDLPNPVDRVDAVDQLKQGFGHMQRREYGPAAAAFRALLKDNPRMTDVWQLLAQCEIELGNQPAAGKALQEAARLSPGNPQVLLALSEYFIEIGKFDEARQHAELARDAGSANAHLHLARIAVAQGDLKTGEVEALAALKEYPTRRLPHLILGRIARDKQDYTTALRHLDTARQLGTRAGQPPLYNLNYLRGDVLARLGREAEAEQAFREEIKGFPASAPAWSGLALLYAAQGREREAVAALQSLARERTPDALLTAARTWEILGNARMASAIRAEARRLYPNARERRQIDAGT